MTERIEILPARVETSWLDFGQGNVGGQLAGFAFVQALLQGNLGIVVAPHIEVVGISIH